MLLRGKYTPLPVMATVQSTLHVVHYIGWHHRWLKSLIANEDNTLITRRTMLYELARQLKGLYHTDESDDSKDFETNNTIEKDRLRYTTYSIYIRKTRNRT